MHANDKDSSFTIAATRIVKAGHEETFEAMLHEFVQQSLELPGQLGVHVLRPAPGATVREYGILRRFADQRACDEFYGSKLFRDWEVTVDPMTDGPVKLETVSGLEAWFTAPGRPMIPPPRWKMACVTLLGVFPLAYFLPVLMRPITGGWPLWADCLLISAEIVVALTWLVMPILFRLFDFWLNPKSK